MADGNRKKSKTGYDVTPLERSEVLKMAEGLDAKTRSVALEAGTERAFSHPYYEEHRPGVFVSAVGGLPLFRSTDKFESGSGWPSFVQPFDPEHVREISDNSHGMVRTEVVDARTGAHLGHVFPDGPRERGGLRYCINGAALRFVPQEEWDAQQAKAGGAAAGGAEAKADKAEK